MVGWIFHEHSGLGRKDDPGVRQASGERRLRTSEAYPLGIPERKSGVGSMRIRARGVGEGALHLGGTAKP